MNQAKINCHCPQCGQMDQIQKISAIYTAGLSTSKVTGHIDNDWIGTKVKFKGQNQTELSKRFQPPEKPVLWLCQLFLLTPKGWFVFSALALAFFLPITWIFVIPILVLLKIRPNMRPKGLKKAKVTNEQILNQWQEICTLWSDTYYCHRCDIVYHPDKPEQVYSPANAKQLYSYKTGN